MINVCTKFEVSRCTRFEDKAVENAKNGEVWGWLGVIQVRSSEQLTLRREVPLSLKMSDFS